MKYLIFITLLGASFSTWACKDMNGVYNLPSMKAQCTTDLDYTPGDDSPLYTIFPKYISTYSAPTDFGNPGYVEANKTLMVSAAENCKTVSLTYFPKKSSSDNQDATHTMTFDVVNYSNGVLTVAVKQKEPWGCDMGLCGKFTELRTLTLENDGEALMLNVRVKTRGLIYAIPFRKEEKPLSCRFLKI